MPDWLPYVRRHLTLQGVDPHRHSDVVEELAQQLEDFHHDAVSSGASEQDATRLTQEQIPDWETLVEHIARTEARTIRSRLTAADRAAATGSLSHGRGRWTMLEDLFGDLRYGLRVAARSPGFTAAAVLTLTLGIGATTAIFTVVNAILLQPLPYAGADRLVAIFETEAPSVTEQRPTSPANFLDWRERSRTVEAVTAANIWMPTLTGMEFPDRLSGLQATTTLFELLDEQPILGRTIVPDDGVDGSTASS